MTSSNDLLREVQIFSRLKERQIARLAKIATRRSFPAGTLILRRGETGVALYVVSSGRVAVSLPSDGSKPERLLGDVGPGGVFGEMALIDDAPRSANVTAVEPTECVVLTRWDFSGELRRDPDIAQALLPVLSGRIRELHERLLAHDEGRVEE